MDVLQGLGVELAMLAASAALMAWYLNRRPKAGLLEPLAVGVLPLLAMSIGAFVMLQTNGEHAAAVQVKFSEQAAQMSRDRFQAQGQAVEREAFQAMLVSAFKVLPAIEFSARLGLLAALAVFLRRRRARLGQSPSPAPLAAWTAPYPLAWLILGPAAWLLGAKHGLWAGADWGSGLAWNLEVVGLCIFLFQGLVVAGAKLAQWSRDPRTRVLALLVAGTAVLVALLRDSTPLVLGLVLIGLFEPWMDFRRQAKPAAKS